MDKKETGIYNMGRKMPPKGMHKMDGHMMKDSEMKKKGKK